MKTAPLLAGLALAGAALFAVQGGEYSAGDLGQLRWEREAERAAVDTLTAIVDSLERAALAIERDPGVQERVARESFGMIRRGEFLYRLVPGDTTGADGPTR